MICSMDDFFKSMWESQSLPSRKDFCETWPAGTIVFLNDRVQKVRKYLVMKAVEFA